MMAGQKGARPMKRYYIAIQAKQDGKNYAYAIGVTEATNIAYALKNQKDTTAANICATRKEADQVVNVWNEGFKANGSYLYA